MPELNSIALRVRSLRDEKKFSNRKFAELLGVSSTMLLDIEKGKRDINLKVLEALKNEFGVSADWVLFGEKTGKGDDLSTLIDDFNKSKELNTMLHVYLNTWVKNIVLYTAKYKQYESVNLLKTQIAETDKTISKIDRMIDTIHFTIADYTVNPSSDLAIKLKSGIRKYFSTVYEFIYFLNGLGNISKPVTDLDSDWITDLIFQASNDFKETTKDVERKTEELLKSRK